MRLTDRLHQIYDFIAEYQKANNRSPLVTEIGKAINMTSNCVSLNLKKMVKLNMIRREGTSFRNIELISRTPYWNALVTPLPGERLLPPQIEKHPAKPGVHEHQLYS